MTGKRANAFPFLRGTCACLERVFRASCLVSRHGSRLTATKLGQQHQWSFFLAAEIFLKSSRPIECLMPQMRCAMSESISCAQDVKNSANEGKMKAKWRQNEFIPEVKFGATFFHSFKGSVALCGYWEMTCSFGSSGLKFWDSTFACQLCQICIPNIDLDAFFYYFYP